MPTCFQQLRSLDELREYVLETLCYQYQLRIDAFQMTERLLRRGDKPCGLLFCLHGPRAVKFTAIWETDRNRILFYGSTGERFQKTQLLDASALEGQLGAGKEPKLLEVGGLECVAA
jgi:hypothetical protein